MVFETKPGSQGPAAAWGKTKFDYYFTDYVDKDYPSSLTRKEERLAAIEQDEALRIQRKLYSTLDHVNLQPVIDFGDSDDPEAKDQENILEIIESQNRSLLESKKKSQDKSKKRKKVTFEEIGSDECEFDDEDANGDHDDEEVEVEGEESDNEGELVAEDGRLRRPISMAIRKNRGLTPYKKKEYRNPRVKHKLKYKKAMTKRRRLVKEAKSEFYRYSGESTGIKTSTVRSIKLC